MKATGRQPHSLPPSWSGRPSPATLLTTLSPLTHLLLPNSNPPSFATHGGITPCLQGQTRSKAWSSYTVHSSLYEWDLGVDRATVSLPRAQQLALCAHTVCSSLYEDAHLSLLQGRSCSTSAIVVYRSSVLIRRSDLVPARPACLVCADCLFLIYTRTLISASSRQVVQHKCHRCIPFFRPYTTL